MGAMKRRNGKRYLVLFFVVLVGVISFVLARGQKQNEATEKEETETPKYTKLVIAYPAQAAGTKEQDMVEQAVNKIVRRKLNIEVELSTYATDYEQNVNSMLIGNEQLDIAFVFRNTYMDWVKNDQLYELDSLMEQYGQGIVEVLGEKLVDTCRVKDKLYGLPNNRDYAVGWDAYILRKDVLDKYQVDPASITTMEALEKVFEIIKENEPNMTVLSSPYDNMLSNYYFSMEPIGTHMDNGQSEQVTNLFETQEYKEILTRIRRWKLAGYLDENILEQDETVEERLGRGKVFSYIYRAKPGVEQQESVGCGTEVVCIQLGENIVANNEPSFMPWVITKNSVSADKSMQLLNLLYTDADLMNLLSYGIEGKHYVVTADGHITYPKGKNTNLFVANAWQMPNQFITYIWEGNPLTLWDDIKTLNEEAIQGCDFGFNFDSSEVVTEYSALQKIYENYCYILGNGLVDPDEGLAKMNQELKNNYIDKVIEEKQRQFNEWKSK